MSKRLTALLGVFVISSAGALYLRPGVDAARPVPDRYVDSTRCAGCHPAEAKRWQNSAHDRAMEIADNNTVLGDFDDVLFEDTHLSRTDTEFFFDRHRVKYTFGFAPLQQYLLEFPGGRLQASALAWDTERAEWFRVQDPTLPYSGRYQTWNTMCADCHSTGVDKAYDPTTETFATTFAEIDVACQACHGPGQQHADDPSVAIAARNDVETCAPCHSRRAPLTAMAVPAEPFTDHYRPMTLQPGLYFADGQFKDEVFEYGSFAQSAMHEAGVTCVDCHDPHSATSSPTNKTCTTCHGAVVPLERFPSLARRTSDLDRIEHHHHEPGSPGAQCIACHMPPRTYLGVDVRHDHRLAVPRPDLSARLGTPDACTTQCHEDREPRWAAEVVDTWFPRSAARPDHYGEILARARDSASRGDELQRLAQSSAPAIVRATALELLLGHPEECMAVGAQDDPSALVRSTAVACAESLPPERRAARAAPALADPSRLVRLEAARVLAGVQLTDPVDIERYRVARAELEAMHQSQRDRPEGAFNLGLIAESEKRFEAAAKYYEESLKLDHLFRPARVNLYVLRRRSSTQ